MNRKTIRSARKTSALSFLLVFLCLLVASAGAQTIVNSKHNLSASGPGPVRAVSETEICVFCHTPHGGRNNAPLWNRQDSTSSYIPYNSPTLKASPGQPTGASKLCLSCHDGTIAMGNLISESQPVAISGADTMPAGGGLIGTDLRDDHPISFSYLESLSGSAGVLAPPGTWDQRVKLDANSEVQCTSCHDPHDNQWGQFLVMNNQNSALCQQCHTLSLFPQTAHALAGRQWNGAGTDPWPHTQFLDVASNACLNCHRSHHAGGRAELLSSPIEENVCFVCHNGNVSQFNLQAVFQKSSTHPVDRFQGVHQAGENVTNASSHVECSDCHNPHRAREAAAEAPQIQGVMEGVTGVDAGGSPVTEAVFEYQVCFKCHGENAVTPFRTIPRKIISNNLIFKFSPSSPSFHPVETAGLNPDVPSLIPPMNEGSVIYCTDCHNNDNPQPGLRGPHGSIHEFLLTRQYTTGDNVTESPQAYALCYGCHNRNSFISDSNETFVHKLHVVDERTPCSVCHDPHGIDNRQGNASNNAHLINFDTSVVSPSAGTGRLEYRSTGPRSGECYLSCHGVNHEPISY